MEEKNINTEATIQVIKYDGEDNICGYAIIDDGNTIPCDKVNIDGERRVIHLPSNSANRTWCDAKKVDESEEPVILTYKAKRTFGMSTKIPNEKLIAFLPEDLRNEYISIVTGGMDAMKADIEANKKKPMTELEKLEAKLAKAKKAYEELLAKQEVIAD